MGDTTTIAGNTAPYTAVVGLLATFSDGTRARVSGALISPTEVLTAAHGVWKTGVGQAVSVVALPFGVPQYTALGIEEEVRSGTYAARIHTNQIADANGLETISTTQSDIALIDFGAPLTTGPVFGLLPDIAAADITIAGFPGGVAPEMTGTGSVTQVPGYTALSGLVELGAGSSGGPLWITGANGQAQIVGTVSTDTYATQITAALVAQVDGWEASDAYAAAPPGGASAQGAATLVRLDAGAPTGGYTTRGNDTVQAGPGLDILYAAGPTTSVLGGSGSLVVVGGAGQETVRGGTGSSTLFGGTGGGVLDAGTGGRSILVAAAGNTTLVGAASGDTMFCAPSGDGGMVAGGAGAEIAVLGQGVASVFGGTGVLTVFCGQGTDGIVTPYGLGGRIDVVGFKPTDKNYYFGANATPPAQVTHGTWGTTYLYGDGSLVTFFGAGATKA